MKKPEPRRILFAVTVPYSVNLLGDIPRALSEEGWDVHVVSSPGPELEEAAAQEYGTCHGLPMAREPSIIKDFMSLCRWIHLLAKLRPEVISIGTPKASLLGMLAGWALRVPHRVYVLRGLRLETTTGFQRRVLSGVEKITSACATQVVAVSASLRRVYLEQNLTHPGKVIVLGHGSSKGVDSDRFRPARKREETGLRELAKEIGIIPGVPVVGLFGRHAQDKGFEVLFSALTDLNRAGVQYQILAIGDDESQGGFTKPLQDAKYRIISMPRVKDLQRYFRLIDVLCLPTLREGLPNIALEAQASGVPIVTTDATGAVDAVEDKFSGIVVKKGSASDLANGLKSLLENEGYRAKLANNARPWVLSRFGSATVISNNLAYYTQLAQVAGKLRLGRISGHDGDTMPGPSNDENRSSLGGDRLPIQLEGG